MALLNPQDIEKCNKFCDICLKNAEDFLSVAESLVGKNVNHIAFHLAVLALEESGRIQLTRVQMLRDKREDDA